MITTGSVTGQVTDAGGALVPNVAVVVTNVDTGVSTSVQTNGDGAYNARFLPIGHYKVTVDAPGFKRQEINAFSVEINQIVKLNIQLTVGSAGETVSVSADTAPILNTTNATLATTFTENQIDSLPLNDRNFEILALFTPGVIHTDPTGLTGSNATERATLSNALISANGNRGQANNIVLDGVEINEQQNNQIGYNVSPDAIGQLQVITGNADAQYGNANGSNQVIVLKSGTNSFHGSAFAYLQNWRFNANSWGNKHVLQGVAFTPRQQYTQSFFGGTFGGPIVRDKLFFFGDYEGIRVPTGSTLKASLLTPAMLRGDFSALLPSIQLYNTQAYNAATGTFPAYLNNQVPVNSPVAKFLAAHPDLYPAPNHAADAGTYIGNDYQAPYSAGQRNDQFDVKADWVASQKDRINGFYAQSRASDNLGIRGNLPITFPGLNDYPTTLFGVNWIRTFSPSVVNVATAGFSRTKWSNNLPTDPSGQFGLTGDAKVGIPFGMQRYVGFSGQIISGIATTVGNPAAPQIILDNTYSYTDNLTVQRGAHLFTFGVQAARYQQAYNQSQNGGGLGSFTYNGTFTKDPALQGSQGYAAADFVINAVNSESLQNGGIFYNRQWRAAGYAQDAWKVRPNLTLTLGVRYEYDQPMLEAHNNNSNVLPLNFGTMEYAHAVPQGAPAGSIVCPTDACYPANYTQIMPRVGFAYQPRPGISLRGGYGATSFFEGNAANQRLTNNPPLVSTFNLTAPQPTVTSGGTALDVTKGFSTSASANTPNGGAFSQWPQGIQPAYIQQYTLTLEQALSQQTLLSIGYVGQTGRHLMMYGNANQFTQAQAYDVYVAYANNPAGLPTSDYTPYYKLGAGTSYAAGNGGTVLSTASRAVSNYNGLQLTVRQRESHGLEYTVNYTFAKSMTNAGGNYGAPNVSINATFQDWYNGRADYGPSGDDIRQSVNAIITYAIPFGHGRMFGSNANRFVDEALGGWRISTTYVGYTGVPVTIFGSTGQNTASQGQVRGNHYSTMIIRNRTINNWWGTDATAAPCTQAGAITSSPTGPCAYGNPGSFEFGTAANSTERGPGYNNLDASLFKEFRTFREQTFGFRADVFNVPNSVSYGNPDGNIGDYNSDPSQSGWGRINGVRNQERRMQLSLKYKF